MKPVIVFCLAFICMGMVLAAPAPEPLGVIAVAPAATLAVPTVVFSGAGTASGAAAIIGAKLLGKAALLAAASQ